MQIYIFYAVIECEAPQEVEGCVLSAQPAPFGCGSEAVYEARSGFTLDGDANITCRDSGEWRGDLGYTQCEG